MEGWTKSSEIKMVESIACLNIRQISQKHFNGEGLFRSGITPFVAFQEPKNFDKLIKEPLEKLSGLTNSKSVIFDSFFLRN